MGIIHSKIYKNYYPVTSRYTEFTEKERDILCSWTKRFEVDVHVHEINQVKKGLDSFFTYDLDKYREIKDELIVMIKKNQFDENGLDVINDIIYSHKYNAVLSMYLFPVRGNYMKVLPKREGLITRIKKALDSPKNETS